MWSTLLLFLLLLIASFTDATRHKIYNWTTYPGIAGGLLIAAATNGLPGFQDSLAGLLACGAIMLLCFVLFDMGGGDLKLVAMMGAFLGLHRGIEAMLWTFVLGAILGVAVLIWEVGGLQLSRQTAQYLKLAAKARTVLPLTEEERQPLRRWLLLAPAALAALVLIIADNHYNLLPH